MRKRAAWASATCPGSPASFASSRSVRTAGWPSGKAGQADGPARDALTCLIDESTLGPFPEQRQRVFSSRGRASTGA